MPLFGNYLGFGREERGLMAYKDKTKKLEAQRRWYQHQSELGLCGKCLTKAFPGLTLCSRHLYKNQIAMKRYYQEHRTEITKIVFERSNRLQKEGKCRACGVKLIEGEGLFCVNCATVQTMRGVLR